eukprot:gb/GECG01001609.1/.p1 GENE.gb/GECG01001609.1/~~gb/GECG01001609.1/.p1  ORF type:complete len:692 (+),score=21.18 gb/GECG01001609.1/:1-2076(+)
MMDCITRSLRKMQDYVTVSLYFHLEALLVVYLTWRILETRPFLGPMTAEQREYESSLEETSTQFQTYGELAKYLWCVCLLASGTEIITQQGFLYNVSTRRSPNITSGAPLHGMTASIMGVPLVALSIAKVLIYTKLSRRYYHDSDIVTEEFSRSHSLDFSLLVLQSLLVSSMSYLCYIVLSKARFLSQLQSALVSSLITLTLLLALSYQSEMVTWPSTIFFSELTVLVATKLDSLAGTIGAISWKEAIIISQGIFAGLFLGGSVLWRTLLRDAFTQATALLVEGSQLTASQHTEAGSLSEMPMVTAAFQFSCILFITLALPFVVVSITSEQHRIRLALLAGLWFCAALAQLTIINTIVYTDPFRWIYFFLTSSWWKLGLIGYWAIWLLVLIELLRPGTTCGDYLRTHVPNIVIRKVFHVVAVAMFVPGIIMEHRCMQLAFVVALQGLLILEMLRILGYWESIHTFMSQFTDIRDEGYVILTHIYLLLGCALPVWLTAVSIACLPGSGQVIGEPHNHPSAHTPQSMMVWVSIASSAGILSLGVGDAAAAMVGSLAGKSKWIGFVSKSRETLKRRVPDSIGRKSVEGTMASLLSILFASSTLINASDVRSLLHQNKSFLGMCDQASHACQHIGLTTTETAPSPLQSPGEGVAAHYRYILLEYSAWLSLYETFTNCVDNLVMPLYAWAACILLL